MQSVLSRNWTRIAVPISCDDNHYTTGTSSDAEALGNAEDLFIAIAPKSTLAWSGSTW